MSEDNPVADANGTDWTKAAIINAGGDEPPADQDDIKITGDGLLNLYVELAEKGVGQGITIYTNGLVISGITASRKLYFEKVLEFTSRGGGNPISKVFEDIVNYVEPEESKKLVPNHKFIHLQDARVIAPGHDGIPQQGTLMRILRDDVIGWSAGQWTTMLS